MSEREQKVSESNIKRRPFHGGENSSFVHKIILLGLLLTVSFIWVPFSSAQESPDTLDLVRVLEADETGIDQPLGLAFSVQRNTFLTLDAREWRSSSNAIDLIELTPTEKRDGTSRIAAASEHPINMVFDNPVNRLLILNAQGNQLVEVLADQEGRLDPATLARHRLNQLGLGDPQGMAVDPASGDLLILDSAGPRLVRVSGGLDNPTVSIVDLQASGITAPRGLAIDPSTNHLHVAAPAEQKLYELSANGEVLAWRDLSPFGVNEIQGMVFAPSGDQTDDPAEMSLYLADSVTASPKTDATPTADTQSTGQIVELSLVAPAALPPGTTLLPASLVRTFDTSIAAWDPSAPDPAGVDYWPLIGRLVIADSEVDEMPAYFAAGKNVFLSTLSGGLTGTCNTTSFTNEPTGVAINPNNNHIFFTTDFNDRVFELSLGADGAYCTVDDTVTTTNVSTLYGITDAEDVAYGGNTIFVAGGVDAEVYVIPLGANGILGGGDDGAMTHFDTAAWGFNDMEGIGFNPEAGTLFIVSTKRTDKYLGETSLTGTLLRVYDLSLMGDVGNIRSDVTYAPGSQNSAIRNIYIASRGVDNNNDPNENDGKIWEINIGSATSNQAPVVSAGPDQTINLPNNANLDGTVSDDGLPNPPGAVTTTWNKVNGPGTVSFGNSSAVDTTASFSVEGVYTLRLTANDSALSASDDIIVTVNSGSPTDLIFADGFEAGNLSSWSSSNIDGGDLSVTPAAALVGTRGMQAVLDDNNNIFATDDRPAAEPRYRARLYFDPNSISMVNGDAHFIFNGFMGTSTAVLRVEFRRSSNVYQLRARLFTDSSSWINSNWFTITDAAHFIEIDWRAATGAGANNGGLTLWIDGVQQANLAGVDNDTRRIDRVRLGAVAGIDTGTRGTYFFDAFESRRQTFIGP